MARDKFKNRSSVSVVRNSWKATDWLCERTAYTTNWAAVKGHIFRKARMKAEDKKDGKWLCWGKSSKTEPTNLGFYLFIKVYQRITLTASAVKAVRLYSDTCREGIYIQVLLSLDSS